MAALKQAFVGVNSASLLPLLLVLFVGLFRLCRNLFRLKSRMMASDQAFDGIDSDSLLSLLFFLLIGHFSLAALSLCHFHFQLNGGFGAGFRLIHLASLLPLHLFLFVGLIGLLTLSHSLRFAFISD
jgi:hypothetical protein